MSERRAEFADVPPDDLVDDLLLHFDTELRHGRSPGWDWYLAQCHDAVAKAALLAEMIRIELEHIGWDAPRIKERIENFSQAAARDEWVLSLLRQLYLDRLELGNWLSLEEFEPFGIAFDQLQLRTKDEALYLGYAVGNRYRIEQRVGKGGFGIVYRGTDISQQTRVALKVSHGEDGPSKLRARGFLEQEAASLKDLPHPNIPRFIDLVSEADLTLCMVCEFIAGRSLHQLIKLGAVAPQKAASISAAIADVLDFAHRRGFVHRDLSPGNVLIDDDDRPYLLDFGLAVSEDTRFDKRPQVGGTRPFMPTESLAGQVDSIDGRSDIWALGALMYAMLRGRSNPLNLQPEEAVMGAILLSNENLKFPSDVPAELGAICRQCLSGNPNDRFDTAGHVAAALHGFIDVGEQSRESNPPMKNDGTSLRLTAWRVGIRLGVADRDQATARSWLHHANSMDRDAQESFIPSMRTALRYELEAIDGFHVTASLAENIGVTLEPLLWFYSQCEQAIADGGGALADAKTWLPSWMEQFDTSLEIAFRLLKTQFNSRDDTIAALFEFAVVAALCTRGDEVANMLTSLAQRSGLRRELWSAFVAATSAESDAEILQREFHRLNKVVERELSYGTGSEG